MKRSTLKKKANLWASKKLYVLVGLKKFENYSMKYVELKGDC